MKEIKKEVGIPYQKQDNRSKQWRNTQRTQQPAYYAQPARYPFTPSNITGQRMPVPNNANNSGLPICYRCVQEGHLMIGCRVIVDHLKSYPLKGMRPPSRRGR